MDWQGESYSLQNPVGDWNSWNETQGGVLDLLNQGLSPTALFLEATPERRVVALPTRARLNGRNYHEQSGPGTFWAKM